MYLPWHFVAQLFRCALDRWVHRCCTVPEHNHSVLDYSCDNKIYAILVQIKWNFWVLHHWKKKKKTFTYLECSSVVSAAAFESLHGNLGIVETNHWIVRTCTRHWQCVLVSLLFLHLLTVLAKILFINNLEQTNKQKVKLKNISIEFWTISEFDCFHSSYHGMVVLQ